MNVRYICERLNFPAEATDCIVQAAVSLETRCDAAARFASIGEKMLRNDKSFQDDLQALSKESGVAR